MEKRATLNFTYVTVCQSDDTAFYKTATVNNSYHMNSNFLKIRLDNHLSEWYCHYSKRGRTVWLSENA